MARIYANENFPEPTVVELRRLGHDVLTMHDVGAAGQSMPDEAILEFAISQGRAVLTLNRKHYIRLHETRPAHAGIIVCTFDRDFCGQAGRIHQAIASQPELQGQLIRVDRPPL